MVHRKGLSGDIWCRAGSSQVERWLNQSDLKASSTEFYCPVSSHVDWQRTRVEQCRVGMNQNREGSSGNEPMSSGVEWKRSERKLELNRFYIADSI